MWNRWVSESELLCMKTVREETWWWLACRLTQHSDRMFRDRCLGVWGPKADGGRWAWCRIGTYWWLFFRTDDVAKVGSEWRHANSPPNQSECGYKVRLVQCVTGLMLSHIKTLSQPASSHCWTEYKFPHIPYHWFHMKMSWGSTGLKTSRQLRGDRTEWVILSVLKV